MSRKRLRTLEASYTRVELDALRRYSAEQVALCRSRKLMEQLQRHIILVGESGTGKSTTATSLGLANRAIFVPRASPPAMA